MLTFDAERHEYRYNGAPVPSVTQILDDCGYYAHLDGMPDGRRDWALERGRGVHAAVAILARNGALDWRTVEDEYAGYIDAYARWGAETDFRPTDVEMPLFSERWRYAGTPDQIGRLKGKVALLDIKTTERLGREGLRAARLQTAAYAHMLPRPLTIRRIVLALSSDGNFTATPVSPANTARDFQMFLACLAIYNHKRDEG